MEVDNILHEQIMTIIENQIRGNDPPAVKLNYQRLTKAGYTDFQARQLIGQCLAVELFDVIKHEKPFQPARYEANLNKLQEPLKTEEDDHI